MTKEEEGTMQTKGGILFLFVYFLSFFMMAYSLYGVFQGISFWGIYAAGMMGIFASVQFAAIIGFITRAATKKRFLISYACNTSMLLILAGAASVAFWAGVIELLASIAVTYFIIFHIKHYTNKIKQEAVSKYTLKNEEKEQLRLYSSVIEQSPLSVVITDAGGFIQYVNPYFTQVTGYSFAEALGKHTRILKSPRNAPEIYKTLWQSITQGENWVGEFTNIDKNGEEFYERAFISPIVGENGEITHFVSIKEDITEARRLKNTLEDQSSFIAQLIDVIPNSIFYVDKNGIFLGANAEFKRVYQIDTNLHKGKNLKDLPWLQAYQYNRFIEMREESLKTGKPVLRQITSRLAGKETPLLYCVNAYYASKGSVDGYIGMMTDISELKENEKKLHDALVQANAATEAKSMFLANMSHEIRTPMNAVIGMSYLAMQTQLTEKQRDYIVKINNAATSLLGIVNDILDFSKIEAGRVSMEEVAFHLDQVILKSIDLMLPKAREKNVEIVYHLSYDIPQVLIGDPLRLGQVITNLLSNAVKFTHHGEIRIAVSKEEGKKEGMCLKFAIADTGIGISKANQSKLFEAFTQSDSSITRQYGGTGLGLTICKSLIELMEGDLWLKSEENVGSTFYFTAYFGIGEGEKAKKSVTLLDIKGMKTLVVDDNAAAGEILKEYMEHMGAQVVLAGSGSEALALLQRKGAEPYQLLLIDWKMPDLDGIETVKKINSMEEITPKPVAVFVTAYDMEELKKAARDLQISAYLMKPVTHSSLYDTIVSIFADTLPLSAKEASKTTRDHGIEGIRILLAEDHEVNQQIARELLELQGCHVDIAENGRKAVALFLGKKQTYDMIFMDIQMPEMDGFEAAKCIREADQRIPIIAMTARNLQGEEDKCAHSGMNDSIGKPIDPHVLAQMVAKWSKGEALELNRGQEELLGAEALHQNKEALPPIDGVNLDEGLLRSAGNIALYQELLYKFAIEQEAAMARIKNSVGEHLAREGHLLKGVAGNIGATEVYRLSRRLENAAETGVDELELQNAVDMLQKEYSRVASAILGVIERNQDSQREPDDTEVGEVVEALMSMLKMGNPEALDYFNEMRAVIKRAAGEALYQKMAHYIERYEFDEAAAIVQGWRKTNEK